MLVSQAHTLVQDVSKCLEVKQKVPTFAAEKVTILKMNNYGY